MSTMKNLLGMLGSGTPASNPFVGANLLTQAQANQARTPAMMQAGLNLLANSGYTTTPTTLGQAIGTAGQAGMKAYNQDLTRRLQLQDMATKRATAQTAAARATAAFQQKQDQLKALRQIAPKYGLSPNAPVALIQEAMKNANKKPETIKDAMGFQRFLTGPNQGQRVFPNLVMKPSPLDQNQIITQERAIQDAARREITPYKDTMDAFARVEAIYGNPEHEEKLEAFTYMDNGVEKTVQAKDLKSNGAADLALVFNFMKAMDPRSVVRESEFEMAASTGGVFNQVKGLINKIVNGGFLTETEKMNLFYQSRNQFLGARDSAKRILDARRAAAQGYAEAGINVGRALDPLGKFYEPIIPVSGYSIVAEDD